MTSWSDVRAELLALAEEDHRVRTELATDGSLFRGYHPRMRAVHEANADRPAILPWGMNDFVFDHHFLQGFRERLPRAEVHEFPDAGHYVLEDEAERIVPLVQEFLARHPV